VSGSETVEAARGLLATLEAGRAGVLHLAAAHLPFGALQRVSVALSGTVEQIDEAQVLASRKIEVFRARLRSPVLEGTDDERTPVDAALAEAAARGAPSPVSRLQRSLARVEGVRRKAPEPPGRVERRAARPEVVVPPAPVAAVAPQPVAAVAPEPLAAVEAPAAEPVAEAALEAVEPDAVEAVEALELEPLVEAALTAEPAVAAEPAAGGVLPPASVVSPVPSRAREDDADPITPPSALAPALAAAAASAPVVPQAVSVPTAAATLRAAPPVPPRPVSAPIAAAVPAAAAPVVPRAAPAPRLALATSESDEDGEGAVARAGAPRGVQAAGPVMVDDSLAAVGDEEDDEMGAGQATSTGGLRLGRPAPPARRRGVKSDAPQLTDDPDESPSDTKTQTPSIQPAGADGRVAQLMDDAVVSAARGDLVKAIQAFTDVLDLRHDRSDAHIGRGRCYLELGDYSSAMSDFQRAEDLHPDRPDPHVAMGDLYFARKEYRRAIEFYDQAVELDGSHAMARCRRGISYYYRKNFRQAFQDLQRAYSLDPEIPNIRKYVQMAVKNMERGD
jgi:Flp pilus assembly protein TadD